MIRPFLVEEITVDVVRVPSATLADLADLLEETADAAGRTGPAAAVLADLARDIGDVLLWRAVRGDTLEVDLGR